jgi:hypothetical protein
MIPIDSINTQNSWKPKSVFAFVTKKENKHEPTLQYMVKIFAAEISTKDDSLSFKHIASFDTPNFDNPDRVSFPVDLTLCHAGILEWQNDHEVSQLILFDRKHMYNLDIT